MTRGDMEENVSGCFFLNTVYLVLCPPQVSQRWGGQKKIFRSLRSRTVPPH